MCDKSKNDWQIVAKRQENTDKVAQKPAPVNPIRAIGKDGACKPHVKFLKKNEKKVEKSGAVWGNSCIFDHVIRIYI